MRRQEHLVFVYGTLLRGQPNHHFMKECRFVTAALTEPAFELVDLGPCPAMVLGGTKSISGEVYAVGREALEALDCLEGHPHFYRRTSVRLVAGKVVEAYTLEPRKADGYALIKSGVWEQRGEEFQRGVYLVRSRRLGVDWRAILKPDSDENAYGVQVIDVSFVGALVSGAVAMKTGEEADLRFDELPGAPSIHVVVRNALAVDKLLGLEFMDPESDVPDRLLRAAVQRFEGIP
jgi:gamma-glutamylaminecyclotransferase